MAILIIFILVVLLALAGVPLFAVMALFALALFSIDGTDISVVIVEIYKISSAPTLLSIPLFTFAGYILAESNSPKRLFRLAETMLGWMPGGAAIVGLFVCAFFTAFTGASGVTIIALGGLLYPILINEKFSEKFTLGLITSSGSLGLLFPPSLPLIIYGLVAHVDVEILFKAGILPGALLIVILSAWAIKNRHPGNIRAFVWNDFIIALKDCLFEFILPILVLVAIYGGFTTVSEAATITAVYVIILECFIHRDLSITGDIPRIIYDSMSLVGAILLILCCALGVTNYLVDEEVPMKLLELVRHFITNKYAFLLFLNIFLLLVGCLMDIFSAIIVIVPLIIPMATEYGVHPVHLAIIFLMNLEIGYITPPVGINLFISSFRFKRPVVELYRASIPFMLLSLVALLIVTYWEWISLVWIEK
ncbi:MAG: C4-dicarboxylate ABC transporter [Bdellovibrionales bacterium RIFOXYD12_FULL_39_22]|nr:MAG: C4-dicarboxylate ABC transporter [Bdellovibrionales bacterium RIFOXYB1_FULL_39_21]OFZ41661.1 MAG: C4-dicarboxylate ABC transporter [Bdellovibrionales bacterium RIFOXYC12_FULL_39_17]OFZ46061.1 MAG: C4-dicarboxylate ABC transporter [Bdellovibrionales bacterium RIFOXYC1_FULL_39_130]OFZ74596.1 MAG: C4-dicarboxylate ABC transporter [Bdellovibrionales bacterium RIFOXYC2_FULL_39_8]OFZ74888.1 MAG: C4-dicarboxylate ABC transporter [Bdellovibrionales bacterium RIFOXYD1_FULL_39_84]OFZ92741.1 MAG: